MKTVYRIIAILLGAIMLLASCRRELEFASLPVGPDEVACSIRVLAGAYSAPGTKSILDGGGFSETKLTGVTIAAYAGGKLYKKAHFTSGFSAISLPLRRNITYAVYALANMGDMTAAFPSDEEDLADIEYDIPSYTTGSHSVKSLGIPSVGSMTLMLGGSAPATSQTITLTRLLAKVTATLTVPGGFEINSVCIRNLSSVLFPFGTSAASGAADMLAQVDYTSSYTSGGTAVFYVPENMQGTVSGIRYSQEKSGYYNSAVEAMADRCTYIEVSVQHEDWGINEWLEGTVTYRSYLGANATTNFDIQRGTNYLWTIHYDVYNLRDMGEIWNDNNDCIDGDWKIDLSDATLYEFLFSIDEGDLIMEPSDNRSLHYSLFWHELYPTGAPLEDWSDEMSPDWVSSDPSVVSVNRYTGRLSANAVGTAVITASIDPSQWDYDYPECIDRITVSVVPDKDYRMEIRPMYDWYGGGWAGAQWCHWDDDVRLVALWCHKETRSGVTGYYPIDNLSGYVGLSCDGDPSKYNLYTDEDPDYAMGPGDEVICLAATPSSSSPSVAGTVRVTATGNAYSGTEGYSATYDVSYEDRTSGTLVVKKLLASSAWETIPDNTTLHEVRLGDTVQLGVWYTGSINGFSIPLSRIYSPHVVFTSTNPSVIQVDQNGLLTASNYGTSVVYVTGGAAGGMTVQRGLSLKVVGLDFGDFEDGGEGGITY